VVPSHKGPARLGASLPGVETELASKVLCFYKNLDNVKKIGLCELTYVMLCSAICLYVTIW
jgi:hypothetical protein